MMEETKGMVMSLQAQIDTLEALKAGKFPELPAAADVKTDVLEPIVQVIEVRYCADSLCTCTIVHVNTVLSFEINLAKYCEITDRMYKALLPMYVNRKKNDLKLHPERFCASEAT